ncbi:MAG: outer membrane beta-barrel protein [Chitinophagaceae bacterium]
MNLDDFEQFLKNQTDKHRMYPSDQIWRNINQQLHGNSRWPALTFAAILTGAILTAGLIFLHPNKDLFKIPQATTVGINGEANQRVTYSSNGEKTADKGINTLKPVDDKTAMYSFNKPTVSEVAKSNKTQQIISAVVPVGSTIISDGNKTAPALSLNSSGYSKNLNGKEFQPVADLQSGLVTSADAGNSIINEGATGTGEGPATNLKVAEITLSSPVDDMDKTQLPRVDAPQVPKKVLVNRFSVEVYGGSNISYRMLNERASSDYHFPYNSALTADPRKNINNLVTQRASIGFEFGAVVSYDLTERLKVKAGLQFNLRQYTIAAVKVAAEPAVLLMNNSPLAIDSVIVYSSVRNADGGNALTIHNRYYQLALPVGLDWTFAEGRRVNFSLGATFQPTYQLNTNMYMLTSDYKNYVQQPDMVRRWNFNAGAEAMANFTAGGLKWQIGPQVRYQLLPTQNKSFSVQEHLIDYGVKVGIVKQLK